MGSRPRQAREWVTNEDSLRPPSPNSQRVRGLYRDAASCPPFNHGPPHALPPPLSLKASDTGVQAEDGEDEGNLPVVLHVA